MSTTNSMTAVLNGRRRNDGDAKSISCGSAISRTRVGRGRGDVDEGMSCEETSGRVRWVSSVDVVPAPEGERCELALTLGSRCSSLDHRHDDTLQ